MLLSFMRPEERVATVLLNLSRRCASDGNQATESNFRMSQAKIGFYLGLKLETVSPIVSTFQKDSSIRVQPKHIPIDDAPNLKQVMETCK